MSDDFRNRLRRELMIAAAREAQPRRPRPRLAPALSFAAAAAAIAAILVIALSGSPDREQAAKRPRSAIPQGSYTAGTVRLLLSDRQYVLYRGARMLQNGDLRASGKMLTFDSGQGHCSKAGKGRYSWKLDKGVLRLQVIGDPCAERRSLLSRPLRR